MRALSETEITDWVAAQQQWRHENGKLMLSLKFEDFSMAWGFMCRVAMLAEQQQHHPEWSNVYNRVDIALVTHDADGITDRDQRLAEAINRLLGSA